MMASNLLSRLLPSASDEPLETNQLLNRRRSTSTDEHREMDIDEENLEARFEAQDLDNLLADAASSHMTTESTAFLPPNKAPSATTQPSNRTPDRAAAWRQPGPSRPAPLYDDDDVPESLLLEGGREPSNARPDKRRGPGDGLPPPVPGPSTHHTRAQWDTTRRQQQLHNDEQGSAPVSRWGGTTRQGQFTADPKEKALWRWVNVTNLDTFMEDVYEYYCGHGIYSMLLRKALTLMQTAFVVSFVTFLGWCIDYPKIPSSHKMSEVLVPKCAKRIHGFWILSLWLFIMYWLYSFVQLFLDIPRLQGMHDFFHHLLDIPDADIQTVQWQQVVARIMALRDLNLATAQNLTPATRKLLDSNSRQRLDAVDIASRLMRQENYLIALFNKDILDVAVPLPILGSRYIFSETTKWHVQLAVMDFVFSGPNRSFNPDFLKIKNRRELVKKLKTRILYTGLISIACAPFTVTFVLASYMFKYFTEYHKDPSRLGSRDFTAFAQWKFREFNELPHLYTRRRNMAYPYANLYLAQFPKDKTEQVSAFVAFVSGAFAMVLFCFTLFDSELFLSFEITPGKTALFWIGIFSAIYSVARGSSPQDDQVQDPAYYLTHVNYHTRYEPASWQGRLHTDEVRVEFSKLYQPKVLIFAEEILSMIITPFLLIFRLPQCSERIVDFFREFSIVVDGLGTVCSYSMFPFKKGDNAQTRGRDDPDLREDYFKTKDDKMMKSFYGFMQDYQLPGNRRQFIPPPQFPNAFGAMSQTAQMPDQGTTTRGRSLGSANGKQGLHHRTPRHGPSAGRDEPIASILLDPHHHPSASTFRNSPRQGLQPSRYQPNRQPYATELGLVRPASSRIEEESSIGDSWRTSRLAQDDEEEEEVQRTGNAHGGVLHLLQEFSKKQTGGGPSAVGI